MQFELEVQKNQGAILLSKSDGVIKIEFHGVVDLATAKFIVKTTLETMKHQKFHRLLVNRAQVERFTSDANIWLKAFLVENRHKFNLKITRVAIVSKESHKIGLYTNFMKTAFQIIFPGVKLASFEFEDSALDWIL